MPLMYKKNGTIDICRKCQGETTLVELAEEDTELDGQKCNIVSCVLMTCAWATTKKQEKWIEVNEMRML